MRIVLILPIRMSGFIIGILLTLRISSFTILRLLDNPIAVMVPRIVEIIVAKIAMVRETYTALIMEPSFISLEYHLRENPLMLVRLFDELNEKIIKTTIGR